MRACVWLVIKIFVFNTAVVKLSRARARVGMGGLIGGGVLDASCVCFLSVFTHTLHTSEEDPHVHQQLTDARAHTRTLSPQLYGRGIFAHVSVSNRLVMCFHGMVMRWYLHAFRP